MKKGWTVYSMEEVKKHNCKADLWLVIDGGVYDCTRWLPRHPGGVVLLQFAGRDASDTFAALHEPTVYKWLKSFQIGVVEQGMPIPDDLKEFRKLRTELWAAGWFKARSDGLLRTMALIVSIGTCCLWTTIFCSSLGAHLLGACLLGLFWKQCLLFAHDCCHRCATRNKLADKLLGPCFGTLLGGIGSGWWNWEHSMHHAVTQVVDADPSAGYPPVFCTDKLQVKLNDWSTRMQLKMQSLLYVPICIFLGRYNLHFLSLVACPPAERPRDCILMAGYASYVWYLLTFLPTWERLPYYFVANSVTGVLHLILNMNHYSMPMQASMDSADKMGFFRFQLTGTSNISTNPFLQWYYGGLEHQVEHHLFPLMPRYNLPGIQKLVKEIALKHDVPYNTAGFFSRNWDVVQTLHAVKLE